MCMLNMNPFKSRHYKSLMLFENKDLSYIKNSTHRLKIIS